MTVATRLSWTGGIQIGTDGYGDFDPDVVFPPAPLPEAVIVAESIDSVDIHGTQFVPVGNRIEAPRHRHRIVVGGKDVTYFRGVQTPAPTYGLESPLLYGSGLLSFPQIHAAFERPGHGALSWLKKFAQVRVQRVNDAGAVLATDYKGFVADFRHDGHDFSVTLGGQATGRAAMQDRQVPIFPRVGDLGTHVMRTIDRALRLPIANTPVTGIGIFPSGGGSQLDWLAEALAMSTQRDGTQWTVMPNSNGAYRMFQKDTETIAASVYIDGYRVVQSLRRDFTEEPNRVWASGIAPDGGRIRFASLPGLQNSTLAFPGSTLHPGDTGDDVVALLWRLYTVGALDEIPSTGLTWTTDANDPVTEAIKNVQEDSDLTVSGDVNAATWAAIFRGNDFSLREAAIRPAVQRPYTDAYLRDATGAIRGRNPKFDPTRLRVDVAVEAGFGYTRPQILRWSKHELADDNTANWVGTITITMGAVIDGEHNPGDPLSPTDIREARSLKPGHNLWLPNWDGGTLVHVSGVQVSPGSVELTVDTRARDTMKVWEVIRRNRESRKNPARQWIAQNRRSGSRDDTGAFYDRSVFGKVGRTFLPGDQWSVIPTPAGRSGTIQTVDVSLRDNEALFVIAAFGKQIRPGRLAQLIGNPLTKAGTKQWQHKNRALVDDHWLAWAMGGVDDYGNMQPCGYWPERVDPTAYNAHSQVGGTAESSTNVITLTSHGYSNGDQVYFAAGVPDGLTPNNNYYVIDASTNTFKVSASPGGSAMGISADATGVVVQTRTADFPPVTGDFREAAGVPYFCKGSPVLWVAIYPDRDCYLQGGRIFEILLDDSAG